MSWVPPDAYSYSHLLGLYLGDGHLGPTARSCQLRFTVDVRYPRIVEGCAVSMKLTYDSGNVRLRTRPGVRVWVVDCAWHRWPEVFPQHGPGRKHLRPIVLEPWQQAIVDAHPKPFLRGLIESDGCRTVDQFTTKLPSGRVAEYTHPRYFFSNLSDDIRRLFCESCEAIGVRWTQSNARNISVSHRASVAVLDDFIGPKA